MIRTMITMITTIAHGGSSGTGTGSGMGDGSGIGGAGIGIGIGIGIGDGPGLSNSGRAVSPPTNLRRKRSIALRMLLKAFCANSRKRWMGLVMNALMRPTTPSIIVTMRWMRLWMNEITRVTMLEMVCTSLDTMERIAWMTRVISAAMVRRRSPTTVARVPIRMARDSIVVPRMNVTIWRMF